MTDPLTVAEAAKILRCSKRRVFELLQDSTLTRGAKYGRSTVILASSVTAALAAVPEPVAPVRRRRRIEKPIAVQLSEMLARRKAARKAAR